MKSTPSTLVKLELSLSTLIRSIFWQSLTIPSPITDTSEGMISSVKPLQPIKAKSSIVVRASGIGIRIKLISFLNASVPILFTELGIDITDVIMDESADDDIDRVEVTDFCKTVEEMEADAVFVSDILDFTRDPDDLLKFLDNLLNRPVLIFDMKRHHAWIPKILDKSDSDEE